MAKKNLQNLLNDLIDEKRDNEFDDNLGRIKLFDIPIIDCNGINYKVVLDDVIIFDGIEIVISKLLFEIREACFFGQTDISVAIDIKKEVCTQLYDFGISKIFFYSPLENLENLSLLYKEISSHLHYIFYSLQSPSIYRGFLGDSSNLPALFYPFNRELKGDKTGMHYLVENVSASHFLRITAEDINCSRLNLRRINYRSVSHLELKEQYLQNKVDASVIYSILLSQCRNNSISFRDSGLQLPDLLLFLQNSGYEELREITINWPRQIINEFLLNCGKKWHENLCRLLMILSDSAIMSILKREKWIEVDYLETKIFISLTQHQRNLKLDLMKKREIALLQDYLQNMPALQKAETECKDLADIHIIFIHHFTNETLAVMGVWDSLNVHSVDTLWVKYGGIVPSGYLDTILSLPESTYRFYGLQQITNSNNKTSFSLSELYSQMEELADLQNFLIENESGFYEAMQQIGMHLFLRAVVQLEEQVKIIIAEDGGYIAPLVNTLALQNKTVQQVCEKFHFYSDHLSPESRNMLFKEWLMNRFLGSVEHTRNGYDMLFQVQQEYNKLAFPACSLAISKFKVHQESQEVANSCLNAMENMMNGQGFILNKRQALVIGSLGAIGSKTMKILQYRLGNKHVAGIDIKRNMDEYDWVQVQNPDQISKELKYKIDFIFGTVGKVVLDINFWEDLILYTTQKNIFIASGSTKRFEFINLLEWVENLRLSKKPSLEEKPLKINCTPIIDPQTTVVLGTIVNIQILPEQKDVNLYFLSNLMPVNFQYYGVPRETMDQVMSEFSSLTQVIAKTKQKKLPRRLLALDHDISINGDLL